MPRKRTWDVVVWGNVPREGHATTPYDCPKCGREAALPVVGVVSAQTAAGGVLFEPGEHAVPAVIRCRGCRQLFGTDAVNWEAVAQDFTHITTGV